MKKSTPAEVEELEEGEEERSPFFDTVRKMTLAAIGAVALAQDEIEEFINRLVERGEIAEKDARKLVYELTSKRRKRVEREMDKRRADLLDAMNIPSKSDIEELSNKIAELTNRVEQLKKA